MPQQLAIELVEVHVLVPKIGHPGGLVRLQAGHDARPGTTARLTRETRRTNPQFDERRREAPQQVRAEHLRIGGRR